jgi:hypothetical protein
MGAVDEDDEDEEEEEEEVMGPHQHGGGLEDEGIDMDGDDMEPSYQHGPYSSHHYIATWNWGPLDLDEELPAPIDHGGADADAEGADFASDEAAGGSDDDDGGGFGHSAARILQDFGGDGYQGVGDEDTDVEEQGGEHTYPGEGVMAGFVTTMAGHTHDLRSLGARRLAGRASPMEKEEEGEEHDPPAVVRSIEAGDAEAEEHVKTD